MTIDDGKGHGEPILGGRYQVIRRLAAGGFGQTFLAQDRHLPGHPVCVIKQLQPRFTDERSLKTARRLFDTEAEVLYTLGNHPQIPRLMAHFEENQEFYLAQEYIDGEPLDNRLVPGHPWEQPRVVAFLADVLQVLTFVHQQNVIHRDIKPANLLRRKDGRIVLIDFGAVKQVKTGIMDPQSGHTNLTVSVGTQGYMPSEQISGQPRFSSDIYAVGMVAIQALTGMTPMHLPMDPDTGELDWPQIEERVRPALHPTLAAVLARMVYYDFRSRYLTAPAVLEALQTLPAELRQAVPQAVPAPSPPNQPPSRHSSQPTEVVSPAQPTSPEASGLAPTTLLPGNSRRLAAILGAIALVAGGLLLRGLWPVFSGEQSAEAPLEAPIAGGDAATLDTPPDASSADPDGAAEDASDSATPEAEATLQQAETLRQRGDYTQAIAQFDQAIAANPDLAEAQWGKCYSLNRLQQPAAAIAACDQALALDPDNPNALSSKGYALQLQNQQQAALALFDQALAQDPDNADILTNRGTALLALQQPQAAVEAFDQAIAVEPN
ncbi:MAG: serine/threonine-protein kinase, partial [Cyanobacteria bacterium P01_A01_bin.135]